MLDFIFQYSFVFIVIIVIAILVVNKKINTKAFINEVEPYFKFLMEEDYVFLLRARYGDGNDEDIKALFNKRIKNGVIGFVVAFVAMVISYDGHIFVSLLVGLIVGYLLFKSPYSSLKRYYNRNLYQINLMLPYYLKSLEILIQHYTVPVAIGKSIDTAPDIFKDGLRKLVQKIDEGDSSVEPYMDFARQYPVRDSMRMMRLLYRLSLGSQESKQQQLLMFSSNVSVLQNKAREQRYKDRLDKMEKRTLVMLMGTGGGILFLLLIAIFSMMSSISV